MLTAEQDGGRHAAVRQYTLAQIMAVWAAATIPMGALTWGAVPWLTDHLGSPYPRAEALLICLTAGLVWQFILVLILIRRELGGLEWPRVRAALWLLPPRDPRSGGQGGRVWLWLLVLIGLFALWSAGPRDFADLLSSDRAEAFLRGEWGWFGVVVVFALFNTVLGEALLFWGLLLPRMQGVFGRGDWLANGALYALYHVHQPWTIVSSVVHGTFLLAYPSRRLQSSWVAIIVHSSQSVFLVVLILTLVA